METYFPGGLVNSDGEPVTDLIEECAARDIHQVACHARWVECPDRDHQCYYMDRNNPVWREYLKAVIRIQIDAGVDGIQLDEAELPMGAFQYGACFCKDCMKGFRAHLQALPDDERSADLEGVDLETFHYGEWLLARGFDFTGDRSSTPLFGDYFRYQCTAIQRYFHELAAYARAYGREQGRDVLVSGNFFNLDPTYLALADDVDLVITEMRNTSYRQPEWYRYVAAFAGDKDVVVVENPYGGVVPELVAMLKEGRGHDLLRLSLHEGAAFGANMTVPYGSWMGSTIEDSFYAPHDLLVEVQDFLADHDDLYQRRTHHELAVVFSVASTRELISRQDASDNLRNARDESVQVPYRNVVKALADAAEPFDVVLFPDGVTAPDRVIGDTLARYRTVVLPDCTVLTAAQAEAVTAFLDGGGTVVVTDRFGDTLDPGQREALLTHPGVRRADHRDLDALLPHGAQVRLGSGGGTGGHPDGSPASDSTSAGSTTTPRRCTWSTTATTPRPTRCSRWPTSSWRSGSRSRRPRPAWSRPTAAPSWRCAPTATGTSSRCPPWACTASSCCRRARWPDADRRAAGAAELRRRGGPVPAIGPADVLVRVAACGVCASDLEAWNGSGNPAYPLHLGHEASGTVEEVGAEVRDLRPGDTVGVWVTSRGYSDYVAVPAAHCRVVHGVPLGQALAEPLACAANAVEAADVRLGDDVVLIGAGFMGNLVHQLVNLRGARRVVVADTRPDALARASAQGATRVVDVTSESLPDAVRELTGGRGADLTFECTGTQGALTSIGGVTRMSGTLVLVGFHQGSAARDPAGVLELDGLQHRQRPLPRGGHHHAGHDDRDPTAGVGRDPPRAPGDPPVRPRADRRGVHHHGGQAGRLREGHRGARSGGRQRLSRYLPGFGASGDSGAAGGSQSLTTTQVPDDASRQRAKRFA